MKIIANKLFITVMYFISILNAFAVPHPPPPTGKRPPPPPGLPIDENILILVMMAVLFGIYIIYNYNAKAKTPI